MGVVVTGGPYLGEIDEKGRIWTTTGWSEHGPAWVLGRLSPPTVGYGWKETGRKEAFQDALLFEMIRP